jgi:hypothetical protein
VQLGIPSGDVYYGRAIINFTSSTNRTWLDFTGKEVLDIRVNGGSVYNSLGYPTKTPCKDFDATKPRGIAAPESKINFGKGDEIHNDLSCKK